jgi:hypothetical protein
VMRLLGVFNKLRVRIGDDECTRLCGGLFSFLKYSISWVSSFLQQKAGKP